MDPLKDVFAMIHKARQSLSHLAWGTDPLQLQIYFTDATLVAPSYGPQTIVKLWFEFETKVWN